MFTKVMKEELIAGLLKIFGNIGVQGVQTR